jgi:polynucleotide 5'-hydroxyl-kinase GRC3/NOL9
MISAVAARKKALAAQQDLTNPLQGFEIVSPPHTPSPVSTPSPRPTSKRKSTAQGPNTIRKTKKKKIKHEKARYFAPEDSFVQQDDMIVIDEDSSEDSDSGIDEIERGSPAVVAPPKITTIKQTSSSKGKRAWSPSRPLRDSSDEEMDDVEDEPYVQGIQVPVQHVEEHPLLSTFEPNWNNNIFALSPEEAGLLESSSPVGDTAVVIFLNLGETISLLGTYAMNVMHGYVRFAGVILPPSKTTHNVFAPRCSPVPALQCVQSNEKGSDSTPTFIPARLRPSLKAECAVVTLRELRTGVEGLGRVCRIFDGVFEASRWHRNDPSPDLGLTGVRMVEILNNIFCAPFVNFVTTARTSTKRHPTIYFPSFVGRVAVSHLPHGTAWSWHKRCPKCCVFCERTQKNRQEYVFSDTDQSPLDKVGLYVC